jgi:hypothetical protein
MRRAKAGKVPSLPPHGGWPRHSGGGCSPPRWRVWEFVARIDLPDVSPGSCSVCPVSGNSEHGVPFRAGVLVGSVVGSEPRARFRALDGRSTGCGNLPGNRGVGFGRCLGEPTGPRKRGQPSEAFSSRDKPPYGIMPAKTTILSGSRSPREHRVQGWRQRRSGTTDSSVEQGLEVEDLVSP